MKTNRLLLLLTVANCILLWRLVSYPRPVVADTVPSVIRARSLEIVDEMGHTRAEIKVFPSSTTTGQSKTSDAVQFRLIDETGGPKVKIGAVGENGGMYLGGGSGYVQVLTNDEKPFVRIIDRTGKDKVIQP